MIRSFRSRALKRFREKSDASGLNPQHVRKIEVITRITTEGIAMSEIPAGPRDPNRPPVHPGAILAEIVIGEGGITASALAAALGISRQMLHGILTEKHPVTVEMAVRLGHVLGNGADIWVNLQKTHDLWHAERRVDVSKLKVLAPAADAA